MQPGNHDGYLLVDLTQSMDDRYRLTNKNISREGWRGLCSDINTRALLTLFPLFHSSIMAHRVHNCRKEIVALEKRKGL